MTWGSFFPARASVSSPPQLPLSGWAPPVPVPGPWAPPGPAVTKVRRQQLGSPTGRTGLLRLGLEVFLALLGMCAPSDRDWVTAVNRISLRRSLPSSTF